MSEPFTIIGLYAAGKAAITGWLAKEGADIVKDKVKAFAGGKAKVFGINQLTQFRENVKLHLRQPEKSIPKALRLSYLQATLQVIALHSNELGVDVTQYTPYLVEKILRWRRREDAPLGVLAQAEAQWLDCLHKWIRAEVAKAKNDNLPSLEITDRYFANLAQYDGDSNDDQIRQRLTEHLIAELEQACPEMPDRERVRIFV